jgi:hypothetical protein
MKTDRPSSHPLAQMRRQMHGTFDDAFRLVLRHLLAGKPWSRGGAGFLHVHQRQSALIALPDPEQDREAQ